MKSPRQVRSDIRTLTTHIGHVRDALLKKSDVSLAQIGKECRRTAETLSELLKAQHVPENYKVAVVGRFKTGKSTFVNELLGANLASEDTTPETAAVTTFSHGPKVKATVRFVAQDEWRRLQTLYAEDPRHIDAHRVKMWASFGKPRKNKDGEPQEPVDLAALERDYVKPLGHAVEIELADDGSKKSETAFRKRLKEFTSSGKPHHCLVQSIQITSPAPILDEGVLLIDTPGLDDIERFRVSLTEKTVEDVDAVLFLTQSGEAYGQSEKEFLVSLLRKGTVKQLIVVITQVDVTYAKHVRNAEDNDDDPEPLRQRIERERVRIAQDIAATLNELSQDDSPAMRRYREQLGNVEIAFTSAVLHRDWKANKPLPCAIDAADPGGVERLKGQLLRHLSTESRLAQAAQTIASGARMALLDLQSVLDTKLVAIRDIKDREVAEQKLDNFRRQFGEAGERFAGTVAQQVAALSDRLQARRDQQRTAIENVSLLAERELTAFETNDVMRHWRSRRSGYWGYMHDFQNRVANRIFPKVQEMLGEYTAAFAEFARSFEVYLNSLAREGAEVADSLELGATLPFDVTGKLKESLERSLQRAQELIEAEEQRVTSMLEDFVDDEVSERISAKRNEVTNILGKGTNVRQSAEVQAFYREVKQLLSDALVAHLRERSQSFGDFLVAEAQLAPTDALAEVQLLLEQAADNIRAAAAALVAGQKGAAEGLVAEIAESHREVLSRSDALLEASSEPVDESTKLGQLPTLSPQVPGEEGSSEQDAASQSRPPSATVAASPAAPALPPAPAAPPTTEVPDDESGDWADSVRSQATVVLDRLRLRDSTVGWPIEKLFSPRFLKGATRMRLIDPYLAGAHQLRNLNEFLIHAAEVAKPKEIEVYTAFAPDQHAEHQARALDNTARDLFRDYGTVLTVHRNTSHHDRYLLLDHGVMFKLGRGLDIYKPSYGLAVYRTAARKVRETEVDVFCWPGHPLTDAAAGRTA